MRESQNNQACGTRAPFLGSPVDSDQHLLLVPLCEKYWSLSVGVILFSMIKNGLKQNKSLPGILRMIHWYYRHVFYCYYEQKDLKFKFLSLVHSVHMKNTQEKTNFD